MKMIPTDKQIEYQELHETGRDQIALDDFIETYIMAVAVFYQKRIRFYLNQAWQEELTLKDLNKLLTKVSTMTIKTTTELLKNFEKFLLIYAGWIFEQLDIETMKLRRVILQATLEQFKALAEGAMSRTNQQILNHIRKMQKEIIVSNQKFRRHKYSGKRLNSEVANFKKGLRKTFPEYFQAMEEGKILTYSNGRKVTLDHYADLSVRTTILNVDRTSVEVNADVKGMSVLEFYLRDNRKLKTGIERPICKKILASKINGKSLVALDGATAKRLGIVTLQEAKMQGSGGPWCRHAWRPVSQSFIEKLDLKGVA